MVKHNVKVVIRSRPTANFASKNLQIDAQTNVSRVYDLKDDVSMLNLKLIDACIAH
jgi:hypothetical protein